MAYRLSVVMIAKDAAELLPDCLASVAFADEIILLDSGSTDATLEIARAAGAKTFINTAWQGYGLQRQLAQNHASGDYILMIDTDERVSTELASAIKEALTAPNPIPSIALRGATYFLVASCVIAAGIRTELFASMLANSISIMITRFMNR